MYKKLCPDGRINELEALIAESLHVTPDTSLETLYALMDKVLKKAPLKEFGVRESDLAQFAKDVIQTQQRLLRNNYVELTEEKALSFHIISKKENNHLLLYFITLIIYLF